MNNCEIEFLDNDSDLGAQNKKFNYLNKKRESKKIGKK